MPKTTSIALDDQLTRFVDEQVASGRYGAASDAVRAGLRLLRDREAKLEELRGELREGEESGYAEEFDFDEFLDEMKAAHAS